jgi:hypothetical protein
LIGALPYRGARTLDCGAFSGDAKSEAIRVLGDRKS